VFIIVVVGIFLVNRTAIEKNFNLFTKRLTAPAGQEEEIDDEQMPIISIESDPPDRRPADREPANPRPSDPGPADSGSTDQKPVVDTGPSVPDRPAPQPDSREQTPKPAETRDRNLYFTQIDNDGQILRSRVVRKIAVSESPLHDVLTALLAGPGADERGRGIITLIPPNTRLLSAIVRGSTAYLSFNEDFLFNTYGVEGYAAQLRQIVWTATEFPTVNDVQFLIEGRRVDYLGEGIWIGSPISRQSF
jgi:hypothetical protein